MALSEKALPPMAPASIVPPMAVFNFFVCREVRGLSVRDPSHER